MDNTTHPRCRTRTNIDALYAAVLYRGPARPLIHRLKFSGAYALCTIITDIMFHHFDFSLFLQDRPIIIPIPLHAKRQRQRGFNQAEKIAHPLAERLSLPVFTTIVERRKETEPQAQKQRQQRMKTMDGAFVVKRPSAIRGKTILLIDDVWTTGATMRSAAKELKRAGAKRVIGLVFAKS